MSCVGAASEGGGFIPIFMWEKADVGVAAGAGGGAAGPAGATVRGEGGGQPGDSERNRAQERPDCAEATARHQTGLSQSYERHADRLL